MRADCRRLAQVGQGHLDAAVPPCPGWTVSSVVEHLAQVYEHKLQCTLLLREPEPWPPAWPRDRDPILWLGDARDRLLELLAQRGPEAPSHTWFPPDQTVGFWGRRMAHETLIHRVDVELSQGPPGPIDRELAQDGVDEVLRVCLAGDWSDAPDDGARGQRVLLRTGERSWEVELLRDTVNVGAPRDAPQAELEGEPGALLLWLWGRGSIGPLRHRGDDAAALLLLRERLRLATQ
ncbi:MAG: maleylpyruvate isomerase family mycothiol-dependent enzyme [Candidatus Dormibacteria bacterium]